VPTPAVCVTTKESPATPGVTVPMTVVWLSSTTDGTADEIVGGTTGGATWKPELEISNTVP
jgi:hypothetical protein